MVFIDIDFQGELVHFDCKYLTFSAWQLNIPDKRGGYQISHQHEGQFSIGINLSNRDG